MWRVLLAAAGVCAALLIGEVLVRLSGLAPEVSFIDKGRFRLSANMKLGYELVPKLLYLGENLEYWDYQEKSNSMGFRDVEHPVTKPPGVFRIVILGDSIPAGNLVEYYYETFPSILETNLRERGLLAETINFGVPGYNTGQELELLKQRGLAMKPDLVIISYCLNDREGMFHGVLGQLLELEKSEESLSFARLNPLLSKSVLFRLVRYRIESLFAEDTRHYPEFEMYDSSDSVERSLREIKDLSTRHGFSLLVTVFPFFDNLEHYSHFDEHEYVAKICRDNRIDCIDLLDALRECGRNGTNVGADLTHPTAAGHRCAARRMVEYITKKYDLSAYSIEKLKL